VCIIKGGGKGMPIKARKMIHYLVKAGFKEVAKSGGHRKFVHPDGRMTEVPMHSKELTPFTQRKIIQEAKLKIK
jgi:predicted RNA binding protein YcfA (HicA-like mRNA interferase family)